MGNKSTLGEVSKKYAIIADTETVNERLSVIESQIQTMCKAITTFDSSDELTKESENNKDKTNKDGVPNKAAFIGTTRGVQHVLSVSGDDYVVGEETYQSLSAAAEAVSGVRRSGWTFWKVPDGRTVKDVYR